MNECESEYKKTLDDYVKKGLLPQKAANDVLSCVGRMSEHQCFEALDRTLVASVMS